MNPGSVKVTAGPTMVRGYGELFVRVTCSSSAAGYPINWLCANGVIAATGVEGNERLAGLMPISNSWAPLVPTGGTMGGSSGE
jgi:hypothetical protein